MLFRKCSLFAMAVAALFALAGPDAFALRRILMPGNNQPGPGGAINLPYQVADQAGTTWMIYQGGWIQQQGNMPMYSQGAVLNINQNQPNQNNNQAKLDPKTGEVVLENMQCANMVVTRRIKIDTQAGYARYIDIIKNPGNAEATVQMMIQTNTNYGVNNASIMADPKRKGSQIAWIAQTSGNKTVAEMFSGKGAKQTFNINYQQGNSQVQASMSLAVPAGKEVAVMHLHSVTSDPGTAQKWVESLKESQLLKEIPIPIRKLIVNFAGGQSFIGDYEILRGELFDVVELRGGDQYRGTLKETSYKLTTFYGPVELPVNKVIGMINVGEFRPRQLVVTVDGEVFGGKLEKETLTVELSSGQITQVPLSQVSRMGYRKRAGEPEEWTFDKPLVMMRSGDRIGVLAPAYDIELATRYGPLKLKPAAIAAIALANEEHGIHQVFLADGSKFAALVTADKFEMKLASNPTQPAVTFPCSAIARVQMAPVVEDPDDTAPTLNLTNEDMLVGALSGKMKLETAFDTLDLEAGQIKSLRRSKGSVQDVQVTLWDDTTVSGQLAQAELTCNLKCGVSMKVPVALVEEYTQPLPQPSEALIKRVNEAVADLNSNEFKTRDRAEGQLTAMGPMIMGTLKDLRAAQNAEAQQRIDSILKTLEKQLEKGKTSAPGGAGGAGGGVPGQQGGVINGPVPVMPQFAQPAQQQLQIMVDH